MDKSTGIFYISTVAVSDLSTMLHDKTIQIALRDSNGNILNSNLSFAVASDGITFTSTRSHVDVIDAFDNGAGPNHEIGASSVTFNNFYSEEPQPIKADDVKKITLQTSGVGDCSVPSNPAGVGLYIDAPKVQGSYVNDLYPSETLMDTFDTEPTGACPSNGVIGTYSGNDCTVFTGGDYGGALTSTSVPTTTGTKSNYAATNTTAGETIVLASIKNYVGFWWSAGNAGNTVTFYKNNVQVAQITSTQVASLIPNNSAQQTAIDGTTKYTNSNYYGHPKDDSDPTEPFAYFHCFAKNGLTFDKIRLSGAGFEFDNLTVANLTTTQLNPKSSLVLIGNY
jgi:hypothetical protein